MATESDVIFCFSQVTPALHLRETEDSWKKIDQALNKLEELTKKGAYKHDVYVSSIKENGAPIVSALLSERTKLSGAAADLITSLAPRLANRFDFLVTTFVPPLIQICGRTNKVAIARAKKCLLLIAKHCRLPSLIPYLREGAQSKAATLRNISVEVMLTLLESMDNADMLVGRRVGDVEHVIRSTATDRDAEVRQWCRKTFELYAAQWPGRVNDFTAAFTPTTKRYLAVSHTTDTENRKPPGSAVSSSSATLKQYRKPLQRVQPMMPGQTPSTEKVFATSDTQPERKQDLKSFDKANSLSKVSCSEVKTVKAERTRTASKTEAPCVAKKTISVPSVVIDETARVPIVDTVDGLATGYTEVEIERASLRAEVAKMSSTTPSRGIAARLALQHFEMRQQALNGLVDSKPRAALTAFAVAASKKSSPRRMPSRVPLVPPPTEPQKAKETTREGANMPQRIMTNLSPTKILNASTSDSIENRPCSPDVFESRPVPQAEQRVCNPSSTMHRTAQSKKVSTISKSLSAKSHLLGAKVDVSATRVQKKLTAVSESMTKTTSPRVARERFFVNADGAEEENQSASPVTQTDQGKPTMSLSTLLARKLQLTQSKKM